MGMASPAPSTHSTQSETQFIPQSDDEETLWTVIEITAERPKHYKVRWDGLDPDTGRPWVQSWVPKGDCTDDLRKVWKKKVKSKEAPKKVGKGKYLQSTTSRVSTPSGSTATKGRNRSATATVTGSRPPESNAKIHIPSKRKRRSEESAVHPTSRYQDEGSYGEVQADPEPEPVAGPSHPRKRRKLQTEIDTLPPESTEPYDQESYEIVQKKKYGKAVPNEDDFEDEARGAAKAVPMKAKEKGNGKGKERPEPGAEGEEKEVPISEIGPPLGVKKNSMAITKSKPKSGAITRSHSQPELLPPLKLTTKPKKSKPSPNRFRSPPIGPLFAAESPTKPVTQLGRTDDYGHDIGGEDDMDLGYPDLPETQQQQQQHDKLVLPSSGDGYDQVEGPPPTIPKIQNAPEFIDVDEIPRPPSRSQSQPQSPSSVGLPASIELPKSERDPPQPEDFDFSLEVPETQPLESSNAQSGVEDPRPDTPTHDPEGVSSAEAAASKPGRSRKSSSSAVSSKSTSKSRPGSSEEPVVIASSSMPAPAVDPRPKILHPIPQISPSTFHPHLPASTVADGELVEMHSPTSSIGYFSSPEKQQTRESRRLESIKNWGSEGTSGNERRESILSSHDALRPRGQELVGDNEIENHEGEKAKSILSDLIEGSSGEPAFEPDRMDELMIAQQMEDAYVDLNGGGGGELEESPHIVPLAQEEEESTQDLEREKELWVRQQVGEGSIQQRTTKGCGTDQEMNIEVDHSVEQALIAGQSTAPEPKPRSRSNSTLAPVVHADVTVEELPPTLSPPRPPTPDTQALTRSQSEPPRSPSHGLRHAMGLLNVKSEEISRLQTALDFERSNNKALTSTVKRLEDALALTQPLPFQPSPDAIALAELQAQRAKEQVLWDTELAKLVAARDELIHSKTSAETDRDFFRDQYAQASGYVSTVRGENVELERRALVAEDKAKDGVGMIKAMFEGQIKTLQGDLAHWKGIAELLQEKDRRTGDDIRRKAAEQPELRAKYAESLREIRELEGVVLDLSAEGNAHKLKLDGFRDKAEKVIHEKRTAPFLRLNGADAAQGDDELVYRCLWRPRGDSNPCLNVFRSPEDLEIHMYEDKHLVDLRSEQLPPSQVDLNGHFV